MSTAIIDPSAHPTLSRRFRLQWEEAQQAHVLLYPEGMVKLNPSAAEILKRCDGTCSIREMVLQLERQFNTSGLEPEVSGFLAFAQRQRWVDVG